jgi:hypothetical protein
MYFDNSATPAVPAMNAAESRTHRLRVPDDRDHQFQAIVISHSRAS